MNAKIVRHGGELYVNFDDLPKVKIITDFDDDVIKQIGGKLIKKAKRKAILKVKKKLARKSVRKTTRNKVTADAKSTLKLTKKKTVRKRTPRPKKIKYPKIAPVASGTDQEPLFNYQEPLFNDLFSDQNKIQLYKMHNQIDKLEGEKKQSIIDIAKHFKEKETPLQMTLSPPSSLLIKEKAETTPSKSDDKPEVEKKQAIVIDKRLKEKEKSTIAKITPTRKSMYKSKSDDEREDIIKPVKEKYEKQLITELKEKADYADKLVDAYTKLSTAKKEKEKERDEKDYIKGVNQLLSVKKKSNIRDNILIHIATPKQIKKMSNLKTNKGSSNYRDFIENNDLLKELILKAMRDNSVDSYTDEEYPFINKLEFAIADHIYEKKLYEKPKV